MHYTPNVDFAFNSVEHIMRDVNNGWIIRYTHANVASFFFIFVYMHVGRGLYYSSYKTPRVLVWSIGVIILILMMAIAFLGYDNSPKWSKYNKGYKSNNRFLIPYKKFNYFNLTTIRYSSSLSTKNNSLDKKDSIFFDRTKQISKTLIEFLKEHNLNPVYFYENLDLDTIKNKIKSETRNLSGIYLILNKVTLDFYVGSASTNKFYARFSNHLFNFNGSKIVKAAVKKYKISEFAFIILELFPEIVTKENNKKLLDLEDFYLKSLLPNYNILTEAGSTFGYKHTEMTRIKLKSNYNVERRIQIGNLNKGKKLSEETIEIIRAKALIREKPSYSKQSILNMKKNSKSLLVYNLDYTVYGEFPSIIDAANSLNCNEKTIRRALKTDKKFLKKRWIIKYC